jgi:hypothetical protein
MKWKTNKETPVVPENFTYLLTATKSIYGYDYKVLMYNKYTKGFVEPLTLKEPTINFWAYIEEPTK